MSDASPDPLEATVDIPGQGAPLTHPAGATLRQDQRSRWERGERILAETYFRTQPSLSSDTDVALELIYGEFVLREELGEQPTPDEYLHRFPQYSDQLQRLFALDHALLTGAPADATPVTLPGDSASAPLGGPVLKTGLQAETVTIGRYLIVAPLDEGGQGLVYRAVHSRLGREVVIKLSRKPLPDDPDERDRLLAEGRILAELDHPNLARIYDLDVHENRAFLVLEYVRGRTLEQVARQEPVSPRQAAALVAQVARALAVAHRRGVLHLDIKPSNILIDETGRPRVIDFGMARLRHAWTEESDTPGMIRGTLAYMAPEQARGEPDRIDQRSDIFALGGLLFFLLVGRPTFGGDDWIATLDRAARGDWDRNALPAAGVPGALAAICQRALAAEPAERYARAEDLAADLEAFARPPRVSLRTAVLVGVVLLAAGIGIGWLAWHAGKNPAASTSPQPGSEEPAGTYQKADQPVLTIDVTRKGKDLELIDAVPLRNGDGLRIEADVPAGLHAALLLFTSDGQLRLLTQGAAGREPWTMHYPEKAGDLAPLSGPSGTELLLVCGRREKPIDLEEIRPLWQGAERWPTVTEELILRLDPFRVRLRSGTRDFGPPKARDDPQGQLLTRLEKLREGLRERFPFFEGVAFGHREG